MKKENRHAVHRAKPYVYPSCLSVYLAHQRNLLSFLYPISLIGGYRVDPQAAPLIACTKVPEQSIDIRCDPQI